MAANKNKIELKRINMNLPVSLVTRVETYAKEIGVNLTNAYIFLINQALNQNDSVKYLPMVEKLMETMKEFMVDSEEKEEENINEFK